VAEGVWLRLAFRGRSEELFGAVWQAGARARRIRQRGEVVELDLPLADLVALRRAVQGHGRLAVRAHGGWGLMLRSLRRRPWRALWPLLALLLYLAAASRVWQVAVVGPPGIPQRAILQEARRLGLYQGVARAGVDAFRIGQRLQTDVSGLIFAAVRLDGVRAVIYAAPAWRAPRAMPAAERGALFAAEPGYITRVVVMRGLPLVRRGQTVTRGEPLVAPRAGESRGQIFARVWRHLQYDFPLQTERSYVSGRRATRWYISWSGGRKWTPLGLGSPYAHARREVAVWRIPIGSVEVARYTYVELRTLKVVRSASYAELRATSLALASVKRSLSGARLLSLRTEVRRAGDGLRADVYIEAETDIARGKAGGRTRD
jgi:sporulation protein YqfD